MKRAVYTGSFDPLTVGHVDIIKRASKMFDELIVCVTENSGKHCLFTPDERVSQIARTVADMPNVRADFADGMVADYCRANKVDIIVRGIRNSADFESEYIQSVYNRRLCGVDTVYLPAHEEVEFVSSSAVRELVYFGADIAGYVPEEIIDEVVNRMKDKRRNTDGRRS